ncbi:MAG: PPC domain-containing protein, partial [Verrucomicrobiales bacterium]
MKAWSVRVGMAQKILCALTLTFHFGFQVQAQTRLENGESHEASLPDEAEHSYNFTVNAGDNIKLRIGTSSFSPRIDLYAPGGALLVSGFNVNTGYRDALISTNLVTGGDYTAVVRGQSATASGNYRLTFVKAPGSFIVPSGDQGGELPNGMIKSGTIPIGDMDQWTFTADTGDGIILRIGTTSFSPRIDLYGPDGTLLDSQFNQNTGFRDAAISHSAASQGTYTVVVSSYHLNDSGSYGLNLAKIPGSFTTGEGDEGGDLPNGLIKSGTIPIGDMDLWTFTADTGDEIILRVGTSAFSPRIDLYGPDGTLLDSQFSQNTGFRDAAISHRAASPGTYTVVVSSYHLNDSGSYGLNLAKIPGSFITGEGD